MQLVYSFPLPLSDKRLLINFAFWSTDIWFLLVRLKYSQTCTVKLGTTRWERSQKDNLTASRSFLGTLTDCSCWLSLPCSRSLTISVWYLPLVANPQQKPDNVCVIFTSCRWASAEAWQCLCDIYLLSLGISRSLTMSVWYLPLVAEPQQKPDNVCVMLQEQDFCVGVVRLALFHLLTRLRRIT